MADVLFLNLFVDCESTQPEIDDPDLGARSVLGVAEMLEAHGMLGTFHVIPGDAEASPAVYQELRERRHEIGLHVHPSTFGYGRFLGAFGPQEQFTILTQAVDAFRSALGFDPQTFCPGYVSTNDYTYGILESLGFRHVVCSLPTRVLPECASIHAGAPLDIHYANRFNRVLSGDMDLVEIPVTVDPESRMWGGKHPQDLRVELVDAKNHWYTMMKAVDRQVKDHMPVKVLRAITHNIFDYSDPSEFRRQTLEGILDHAVNIAQSNGLELRGVTSDIIAEEFRRVVPRVDVHESGDQSASRTVVQGDL